MLGFVPVSFLSLLPGSRLPSLPSQLSKGKRLCFSTRVLLYICRQLIKYFHFAPFPSGNRCLTAKLFCLTRAATDYTCWLQTRGLLLPPSPPFFLSLKEKKNLYLCTARRSSAFCLQPPGAVPCWDLLVAPDSLGAASGQAAFLPEVTLSLNP